MSACLLCGRVSWNHLFCEGCGRRGEERARGEMLGVGEQITTRNSTLHPEALQPRRTSSQTQSAVLVTSARPRAAGLGCTRMAHDFGTQCVEIHLAGPEVENAAADESAEARTSSPRIFAPIAIGNETRKKKEKEKFYTFNPLTFNPINGHV
jgi:hypothetical protein